MSHTPGRTQLRKSLATTVIGDYDSDTMRLQLNYASGIPVYLQLVEQIKAAAAAGSVRVGEPLPSVRVRAEELRINRNTKTFA